MTQANSWRNFASFSRAFHYSVSAPIDDVIAVLAELDTGPSAFRQKMTLLESAGRYSLWCAIQRKGETTATAEGAVWDTGAGIHIDGVVRTNNWYMFRWLMIVCIAALFGITVFQLSFVFLLIWITIVSLFLLFTCQRDRQYILDQFERSIQQISLPQQDKTIP